MDFIMSFLYLFLLKIIEVIYRWKKLFFLTSYDKIIIFLCISKILTKLFLKNYKVLYKKTFYIKSSLKNIANLITQRGITRNQWYHWNFLGIRLNTHSSFVYGRFFIWNWQSTEIFSSDDFNHSHETLSVGATPGFEF